VISIELFGEICDTNEIPAYEYPFRKVTVSCFPFIRIVVNACLIAAMVIQPLAIVVAQGNCGHGQCREVKTVCRTCHCCEVTAGSESCGCFRGGEAEAGGCCDTETSGNDAGQPDHGDRFDEALAVTPRSPKSHDEVLQQEQLVGSSCLCGIRSEPLAPAPPRVPVPQIRNLVVVAYLDRMGSDADTSIPAGDVNSRLSRGNLSPHFSQRFLCVWRI
jgi:hypothetical protein